MDTTNALIPQMPTFATEIERDPRLKSAHTRRQYSAALGAFEMWRNGRTFNRTLVEEYASELQKRGLSPSSIKQAVAVVKWWIRRCIDLAHEQLPREQAREFEYKVSRILNIEEKTVAKGTRLPTGRHIENNELDQLLDACRSDPSPAGLRDAAMITLAANTALRNEELRALTVNDLTYSDDGTAELKVQHGKGDKARIVDIFPRTLAVVDAWIILRGVGPGPILCPVRKNGAIATGSPIGYEATRKILHKRFIQSALAKNTTWHDFRRTAIGLMFDQGIDVSTMMQISGHSDPKTLKRYDRRPDDRRKEALRSIER